MKNKVSLLTLALSGILSSCMTVTNNSNLDIARNKQHQKDLENDYKRLQDKNRRLEEEKTNLENEKNQLETDKNNLTNENNNLKAKNEELQEKVKTAEALENGDWKIIDGNGVDVEKTGDALGFTYKYDNKKITNGKTLSDIPVNKDITLTNNFEKMFEGLINNPGTPTASLDNTKVDNVISALTKFKEGKKISELSADEQTIIKKLDGCSAGGDIKYETIFGGNDAKKKMYDLVLEYLKTKNLDKIKNVDTTNKKLKYKYKEKNTLTQGRKDVRLKYSDFGYWEQSFDTTGMDNAVKEYLKDNLKTRTLYFATGADNYKSDFNTDKVEKDLTFTGKTFASATKGDKVKALTGAATLSIKKGEATGQFGLDFENWYKFSLDKLNLDDFTAAGGSTWKVEGNSSDSDFKFNDTATEKKLKMHL